ncbi:MAG TPA: glycosyltransferase [Actinomycetota bacterium]|jgi:GT2 family glycosyltransferase|nr:glycosyltransferase [Actinomycetota bacterium]
MDLRSSTATEIVSTRKAGAPAPRVSVAVSTYQRASMLGRLFAALDRQTLPKDEFEVVLVDNGSSPETARAIRDLAPAVSFPLHVLRLEDNKGPSAGRNIAWRNAQAEIVAFTDDDCSPADDWLEQGLDAMCEGNSVVVGRTKPDPALPIGPFSRTVHVGDANWLPTCNVFYLREDLEAVGGFDEAFVEPGCEDTDLGYRVRAACGRDVRFVSEALVFHDVRPSKFLDAAKETGRWTDTPRFFRIHPEGRAALHRGIFWKPSHPKVLLALAGILLAPLRPWTLVLTLPWLYYRTRVRRPPGRKRHSYAALPGTFVVDLLETVAMVRGSIRHRTFIL